MIEITSKIPSDWKNSHIGNYTTKVEYGISIEMNSEYKGIPILRMNNLDGEGNINFEDMKWADLTEKEIEKFEIKPYDILFNRVNSLELVGKTSIIKDIPFKMVFASYLIRINLNDDSLLPTYLNYYMNSFLGKNQIHKFLKRASSQVNINAQEFKSMEIIVPPLPEQHKIASILSNVDAIIQSTQQLIDQLQILKRGLMQKLFTEGLGEVEFQETIYGNIPKYWKKTELKKITINFSDSPFGTKLKTKDYEPNGIPIIRGNNIVENEFIWKNKQYTSIEKYNELSKSQTKTGDIIFQKIGTVGVLAILPEIEGRTDFLLSTNTMSIRLNENIIDKNFLYYFFTSNKMFKYIKKISRGSTQEIFNFTMLKNLNLYLPPFEEQKEISKILLNISYTIKNEKNYLEKLKIIKKGLMQQLLTGKIRVKVN